MAKCSLLKLVWNISSVAQMYLCVAKRACRFFTNWSKVPHWRSKDKPYVGILSTLRTLTTIHLPWSPWRCMPNSAFFFWGGGVATHFACCAKEIHCRNWCDATSVCFILLLVFTGRRSVAVVAVHVCQSDIWITVNHWAIHTVVFVHFFLIMCKVLT